MQACTPPLKFRVRKFNGLSVHTFISSFENGNIANATHILETSRQLLIVDGQFLNTYAHAFRAYADSLNKPIDRLYISHRHPDHWFGVGDAFSDIPVYALPEVQTFIRDHGADSSLDHQAKMGEQAPKSIKVPCHTVSPGEAIIDGVRLVFDCIQDTEIDFLLTIGLPEYKIFIAQDLVYSGTHLYITEFRRQWITVLESLLAADYELFLPGHGLPADKNEIAENIKYLMAADAAIADGYSGQKFKEYMLKRFPARECDSIFDIYLPRLFDGASSY